MLNTKYSNCTTILYDAAVPTVAVCRAQFGSLKELYTKFSLLHAVVVVVHSCTPQETGVAMSSVVSGGAGTEHPLGDHHHLADNVKLG